MILLNFGKSQLSLYWYYIHICSFNLYFINTRTIIIIIFFLYIIAVIYLFKLPFTD